MANYTMIDAPMRRTVWPDNVWPRPDHMSTMNHSSKNSTHGKAVPKAGKLRKWPTPAHLEREIDKYFESCLSRDYPLKHDEDGNEYREEVVTHIKPFTISGLAVSLKCCRQTLIYYEGFLGDYKRVIRAAKGRCEAYAEESLFSGKSVNGVIFSMKNSYANWHDTRREEISGPGGGPVDVKVYDQRARTSRDRLLLQVEGEIVKESDSSQLILHKTGGGGEFN